MTEQDEVLEVVAECGECGSGDLYMVTCDMLYGTGHEWALASICGGCLASYVIARPCPDCRDFGAGSARDEFVDSIHRSLDRLDESEAASDA